MQQTNPHPSFRSLDHDWLDALSVLVKAGGLQSVVREVYNSTDTSLCETSLVFSAKLDHREGFISIKVNPDLPSLPRVERIELLCFTALRTAWHSSLLRPDDYTCERVGCADTLVFAPRERWRRIGIQLDPRFNYKATSLVALMFEDRPKCGWCPAPIVTGSASAVRPDLHEGCYQYIMDVVRPQVIASREAEKKAYAGGISDNT